MGTRSLTHIANEDGKVLTTIYQQYDGYPEGVGQKLHDILNGSIIVNGFGGNCDDKTHNGMGCLAATLIAKRKEKIGNVYIYPAGINDCGEDFTYTIKPLPRVNGEDFQRLNLKVESFESTLYDGPLDEFKAELIELE